MKNKLLKEEIEFINKNQQRCDDCNHLIIFHPKSTENNESCKICNCFNSFEKPQVFVIERKINICPLRKEKK